MRPGSWGDAAPGPPLNKRLRAGERLASSAWFLNLLVFLFLFLTLVFLCVWVFLKKLVKQMLLFFSLFLLLCCFSNSLIGVFWFLVFVVLWGGLKPLRGDHGLPKARFSCYTHSYIESCRHRYSTKKYKAPSLFSDPQKGTLLLTQPLAQNLRREVSWVPPKELQESRPSKTLPTMLKYRGFIWFHVPLFLPGLPCNMNQQGFSFSLIEKERKEKHLLIRIVFHRVLWWSQKVSKCVGGTW